MKYSKPRVGRLGQTRVLQATTKWAGMWGQIGTELAGMAFLFVTLYALHLLFRFLAQLSGDPLVARQLGVIFNGIPIVCCAVYLCRLVLSVSATLALHWRNRRLDSKKQCQEQPLAKHTKREPTLSVIYSKTTRSRSFYTTGLLIFAALLLATAFAFSPHGYSWLCMLTPLIVACLVLLRSWVINHRVTNGMFGTNEYEARELIDFIIRNSDNLDSTGPGGKGRRALLPETMHRHPAVTPSVEVLT